MSVANIILKCSAKEIIKKSLKVKNKVDFLKLVSSKESLALLIPTWTTPLLTTLILQSDSGGPL